MNAKIKYETSGQLIVENKVIEISNDDNLRFILIDNKFQIEALNVRNCRNLETISIINQINVKSIVIISNYTNCKLEIFEIEKSKCQKISAEQIKIKNLVFTDVDVDTVSFSHIKVDSFEVVSGEVNGNSNMINNVNISTSTIIRFKAIGISVNYLNLIILKSNYISFKACKINNFDAHKLIGINFIKPDETEPIYYDNEVNDCTINFINTELFESFKINSWCLHENKGLYILELDNVSFKKSSEIILSKDNKFIINVGKVECQNGLLFKSNHDSCQNQININYSTISEGMLLFEKLLLEQAILRGFNGKLSTIFKSCAFKKLGFQDFDNRNILKFTNSRNIEKLSIMNSELNDVIFRPLKANSLDIHPDSFLGGMKIYGSDAINLDSTELSLENKQEFYRQLKQAAKNSNNKFLELEYKAKEMAHYKPSSWGDKRSHWVNSFSDHGTNWVKPLIYIFYWNIVIWLILTYNLYTSHLVINLQKGYSLYKILVDLSFGFWIVLNPVSRMSEFSTYLAYYPPIHFSVPFLFYGAKILNGILIYQMISAFRKWVGKD